MHLRCVKQYHVLYMFEYDAFYINQAARPQNHERSIHTRNEGRETSS